MHILESLRRCFALVAQYTAGRRPANASSLPTAADLRARLDQIDALHAPPLQKNVLADPHSFNIGFDWMCLMADRAGPPAGVRTLFRLRWYYGTGVQVAGRNQPEGSMRASSMTDLKIVLPLERLLPEMAAIQARQQATFGITPCRLRFERARFDEVQELVHAYRRLQPLDRNNLKLIK